MAVVLTNNSFKIKNIIKENIARTLTEVGLFVVAEAKKRARVGITGNLVGSIEFELLENDKGVRIGTNVEYAIYIEKGTGIYAVDGNGRKTPWGYEEEDGTKHWTRGSKPYPFLTPAIDENMIEIARIIYDGLEKGLI